MNYKLYIYKNQNNFYFKLKKYITNLVNLIYNKYIKNKLY